MSDNTATCIYVLVSLVAIAILISCVLKNSNGSWSPYNNQAWDDCDDCDGCDNICLCDGLGRGLCADRYALRDSYLKGNTEYQDLAAAQKAAGGPYWRNTNFNEY